MSRVVAPPGPLQAELPLETGISDLRRRYLDWRATDAGRAVLPLFERFALEITARRRSFGFRLIAERVRWEIKTTWDRDEDDFKINDHYTPYIAREIVGRHPAMAELVEFRRVRG